VPNRIFPKFYEKAKTMSIGTRILISIGILALHFVGIFIPLTEFFLIYIILFNPRWFRNYLNNMAKGSEAK